MKNKVINSELKLIKKYKNTNEKDIKIYTYGLEALYNLTTKIIVLIIINLCIGTIKEYISLTIFYAFIRLYAFGIHANSSIGCWISTLSIYTIGSIIIKYCYINSIIAFIIMTISIISILLWAPADTPKRPIIREEQRKKMKIKTLIITIIYVLLLLTLKSNIITNAIVLSLLIESICINPITYKLFNIRFNNYKYYKDGLN